MEYGSRKQNLPSPWPVATLVLLGANIAYLVFLYVTGAMGSSAGMVQYGAIYIPYVVQNHEYFRLITAMFMHFNLQHIFGNMLLLIMLGRLLEREFGVLKFVLMYLVIGVIANIASVYFYAKYSPFTITAGASGAVLGLVGIMVWILIVNRGRYQGISLSRIVFMIIFTIYNGVMGGGINNIAHIAGLACGFVCGILFYRPYREDGPDDRDRYYRDSYERNRKYRDPNDRRNIMP